MSLHDKKINLHLMILANLYNSYLTATNLSLSTLTFMTKASARECARRRQPFHSMLVAQAVAVANVTRAIAG